MVLLTLSALSPTASVFVTGSTIFRLAGTGAALAVLAGGAIMLVIALLVAELSAAFPSAGGVYPGISAILGPGAGLAVAVLGMITSPALLAFLANGFAEVLRMMAPGLPVFPVALSALAIATVVALLDIRTDARITGGALAAELLALLVVAAMAAAFPARGFDAVLLHPVMATSGRIVATPPATLMLAVVAGAFACSGAAVAAFLAEDLVEAPSRIGRLVMMSAAISTLLICAPLVLVARSMPDLPAGLSAEAPIAHYVTAVGGPALAAGVALAVAVAVLNNIIAFAVASSRLLFATGRDGLWPAGVSRRLARRHPRFGSPWVAVLVLMLIAVALSLVDPRRLLVLLSGEVFTGLLLVIAIVIGRRRGLTGRTTFRAPLFPLAPVIGLIAVMAFLAADWLDRGAGRPSLILLGTATLISLLIGSRYGRRLRRKQDR